MPDHLSLPEAARLTEVAMNACNLSGLAHDFPRIMAAAHDDVHARIGGTDEVNTHPLAILWLVKMAELAGLATDDAGSDAIHRAFVWLREQNAGVSSDAVESRTEEHLRTLTS